MTVPDPTAPLVAPPADPAATPPAVPPSTTPPADPAQPPADGDVSTLPDWAQKALRDARADAGRARTAAKATAADEARRQLAAEIGKALGLTVGDTPPDPAELTSQVEAARKETRQRALELAVYRAAGRSGADPDALLDSRGFLTALQDVDPAAADAAERITAAVADAVKNNSRLAASSAAPPAPARSGAGMGGAPGTTPITEDQLAAMSPEQIAAAVKAGQLKHLL